MDSTQTFLHCKKSGSFWPFDLFNFEFLLRVVKATKHCGKVTMSRQSFCCIMVVASQWNEEINRDKRLLYYMFYIIMGRKIEEESWQKWFVNIEVDVNRLKIVCPTCDWNLGTYKCQKYGCFSWKWRSQDIGSIQFLYTRFQVKIIVKDVATIRTEELLYLDCNFQISPWFLFPLKINSWVLNHQENILLH